MYAYREPTWGTTDVALAPPTGSSAASPGMRRRGELAATTSAFRVREPVRSFPTIELNGVKLHAVTEAQVISHIIGELDAEPRRRRGDAEPGSPSSISS